MTQDSSTDLQEKRRSESARTEVTAAFPSLRHSPLLLEETFKKVFRIKLNQDWIKHKFIGREYKSDILQCYMEIEILELPKIMRIQELNIYFWEKLMKILHPKSGKADVCDPINIGNVIIKGALSRSDSYIYFYIFQRPLL